MAILIGAILVAAFLFAFGCGVVLLIKCAEFLISYYGAIIFVIPFVVSISLLTFVGLLYFLGKWSKKQQKKMSDAQKIKELNKFFEVYKEQKSKEEEK